MRKGVMILIRSTINILTIVKQQNCSFNYKSTWAPSQAVEVCKWEYNRMRVVLIDDVFGNERIRGKWCDAEKMRKELKDFNLTLEKYSHFLMR